LAGTKPAGVGIMLVVEYLVVVVKDVDIEVVV
jgi:hypothetical protein